MMKTKRYATEAEIETSLPGSKLNFGGNLLMRVSPSGERAFHFRVCLNRSDTTHTIGKYPNISLAQARKIAGERQSEVVRAREEGAMAAFRARLVPIKQKPSSQRVEDLGGSKIALNSSKFAGFRCLEDAGKFVQGLVKARQIVLPEMHLWLLLKLLIPSRTDSLLGAMWKDLDLPEGVWIVRIGSRKKPALNEVVRHVALLSPWAKTALAELHRITGAGRYLFPTLKDMPQSALRVAKGEALELAWPQYWVDPDEFATFFERVATMYSLFHPALVEGMLAHRPGSIDDYNYSVYVAQLRSLAAWWGDALEWFSWNDSRLPWGGTQIPPHEQGRFQWGRL